MLVWVIIKYHSCCITALSVSRLMPWGLLFQMQLKQVKTFPPPLWPSLPLSFHTSYSFCSWVRKILYFSECLSTSRNWMSELEEIKKCVWGCRQMREDGNLRQTGGGEHLSVGGPSPLGRCSQYMRFHWDILKPVNITWFNQKF